jgi:DNA-binding NarL/FixJ family response regulator
MVNELGGMNRPVLTSRRRRNGMNPQLASESTPARRSLQHTVLVIDDDPSYATYLTRALTRAGYRARTATNLAEAREEYQQHAPDLVLLDVNLGSENGLDLFEMVGGSSSYVPCVVITADATVRSAVRALRESAIDYVEKKNLDVVQVVGQAIQLSTARRTIATFQDSLAACSQLLHTAEAEVQRVQELRRQSASGEQLPLGTLSEREWEVVQEVRKGASNKEIAAKLCLSHHTVANHLRSVFRKLGVNSRLELVSRL